MRGMYPERKTHAQQAKEYQAMLAEKQRIADLERDYAALQREVAELKAKLATAEDAWHMANGTADLAMKHRDAAEQERDALKKRLAIAELQNKGTLANNLCPDHRDKQTGKPCLACTIETQQRKLETAEQQCRKQLNYSIFLQRGIESAFHKQEIREELFAECPHHAEMIAAIIAREEAAEQRCAELAKGLDDKAGFLMRHGPLSHTKPESNWTAFLVDLGPYLKQVASALAAASPAVGRAQSENEPENMQIGRDHT